MMYPQRFFLFLLIFFFCSLNSLFAQTLSLADILTLYQQDSSSARQYCIAKKFVIAEVSNDGAKERYKYQSGDTGSTARLEIFYPNDSASLNVQLNYWFADKNDYKKFQKSFRKNGFIRKSVKQVQGSVSSHAERYTSKNLQAELINPGGKQPFWLFLHPAGNYSW